MKSIDHYTKLLLKNKNLENPNSFEELGYIFFGPIVFNFFIWLKSEIKESFVSGGGFGGGLGGGISGQNVD